MHEHLPTDHHSDIAALETEHSTIGHLVDELDSSHLAAHLDEGDVDASLASKATGKTVSPAFIAICATLVILLILSLRIASLVRYPALPRPPQWRKPLYLLLAPSHAPPAIA